MLSSPAEKARAYRRRRTGHPAYDVTLFASLLREVGVAQPVDGVLRAVRALELVALEDRADVHATLRCAMTSSLDEAAVFDIAFDVFWAAHLPETLEMPEAPGDEGTDDSGRGGSARPGETPAGRGDGSARRTVSRATYSRVGRAEHAGAVGRADAALVEALAQRLVRALGRSRSRRTRVGSTGEALALRESLRHNLHHGGEMLDLLRSRRVRDRARLVVLCDVSSSMEPVTPLFLTFVHALTRIARPVECAIFNVETSFVTDVFRRRDLQAALAWLRARSIALAGGTRIGHCLHAFTTALSTRGLLRPDTTALILSDGWDVGEPELLDAELRRLRGQVGRLVWLDPHAAASGFAPQVQGLRVALPHVDDYLDFSGVQALSELVRRLEGAPAAGA